jgi:hypothetical protein
MFTDSWSGIRWIERSALDGRRMTAKPDKETSRDGARDPPFHLSIMASPAQLAL